MKVACTKKQLGDMKTIKKLFKAICECCPEIDRAELEKTLMFMETEMLHKLYEVYVLKMY